MDASCQLSGGMAQSRTLGRYHNHSLESARLVLTVASPEGKL